MNNIEFISYFKKKYSKDWLKLFDKCSTKKLLYDTIRNLGIDQCSLSTFYNHSAKKYFSREKYIIDLIQIENIKTICTALKIQDDIVDNNLPILLEEYEKQKIKNYNYAIAHYRHKS